MRTIHLLVILIVLALLLAAGCTGPGPAPTPGVTPTGQIDQPAADPSTALARFTNEVNTPLLEIDRALASAATELGTTGISGPEANETLARLAASSPYTMDAVTISPEGRIAAVMPEQYWGAIGVEVGNESHNQQALREKRPLMTPVFPSAEGFDAVSIRRPVWNSTGAFLGLATVLVNPSQLLAAHADRALAGTNFTAWAMQADGFLIYDRDPGELVGHNLFTDPLFEDYPDLVALATRMAAEPSGTGTYTYVSTGGGRPVTKEAVWATAGLHGTEWRLVVAEEV
ncbi:MAG: cache domain-containing protein [Methanomicrobiaceae archaeon]|nr:cache domain-containing protein [Methanomicrobiaceae archaeon]